MRTRRNRTISGLVFVLALTLLVSASALASYIPEDRFEIEETAEAWCGMVEKGHYREALLALSSDSARVDRVVAAFEKIASSPLLFPPRLLVTETAATTTPFLRPRSTRVVAMFSDSEGKWAGIEEVYEIRGLSSRVGLTMRAELVTHDEWSMVASSGARGPVPSALWALPSREEDLPPDQPLRYLRQWVRNRGIAATLVTLLTDSGSERAGCGPRSAGIPSAAGAMRGERQLPLSLGPCVSP